MPPGISGPTSASIRRPEEDDRTIDETRPARPAIARAAAMLRPSSAVDTHLDDAIADACRNHQTKPSNDRILYVGMNEASRAAEADALRKTGAAVMTIAGAKSSLVTLDGKPYDLATDAESFADDLAAKHHAPPSVAAALAKALEDCPLEGRDELARIAMAWMPAEDPQAAQTIPSRVVLSGHHSGGHFYDGFRDSDLRTLARAMPNAAKQIEDIHFAGCITDGNVNVHREMTSVFPNLRTIWGYAGLSPNAPLHHLAAWERATRGRADVISGNVVPASENAVAWSRGGDIVGKHPSYAERVDAASMADARYDSLMSGRYGASAIANTDYEAYRALESSPDATNAQRAHASERAEALYRLRHYSSAREGFANAHGARIKAACDKAGISPAPDFKTLSRKDAVERVAEIRARVVATDPSLGRVLDGLVKLDATVKEEWCQ